MLLVVRPDAVVHPGAVMVHLENALVALAAVVAAVRFALQAPLAHAHAALVFSLDGPLEHAVAADYTTHEGLTLLVWLHILPHVACLLLQEPIFTMDCIPWVLHVRLYLLVDH